MKIKVFELDYNESDIKGKFVWKEVSFKSHDTFKNGEEVFVTTEGVMYYGNEVYAIKNDIRRKKDSYVYCNNCRLVVPFSKWEEHCDKIKGKADCFKCNCLSVYKIECIDTKFRNANMITGETEQISTYKSKLRCSNSSSYNPKTIDINFDKERYCKFCRCKNLGYRHIDNNSIFVKYPNFYGNKLITVKRLVENDFNPISSTCYKYKNSHLYAYINECGIVMYFRYEGRNFFDIFNYSPKYDIFVGKNDHSWIEISPTRIFPNSQCCSFIKLFHNLYSGLYPKKKGAKKCTK